MTHWYSTYSVNFLLVVPIIFLGVFSTPGMTPCPPKNIPNLGIKLCQLKCHENNLCSNFEYNVEDLPCRLSRNVSKKTEKPKGASCPSVVTSYQCPSKTCRLRQGCLETQSGKAASVLTSADKKRNAHERCPQEHEDKPGAQENSPLHDACRTGNLDRVKRILLGGLVDVNSRIEKHKMTPLMVAAQEGHRQLFDFLLEKGAHVSDVDEYGDNVLHLACRGGRMGIVKDVVKHCSVDINSKGMYGSTPLLQTVYCGHKDVLMFLESERVDLEHLDDDGQNVLHWACRGGHLDIVKHILTQYSVDINSRDNHGQTPLMKSASEGHRNVFQFLVSMGANVSHVDDHGDNILHRASIGGHPKMVQHIISQDMVDINSRGRFGRTSLMRAAYYGHKKVFDLIVSKGGQTHLVDGTGNNIIHLAAWRGRIEMMKHILSQNLLDVYSTTKTGGTPLMKAASGGHKDVFEFLVSMGANVSNVDDHGDNILIHASVGGHAKMVQHIISQNMVDINSRGRYGRTSLMRAAYYGRRKVFDLLVSKGGQTHLVDDDGETILHLAAGGGQVEMVRHIISQNIVNINSRTDKGQTPLMKAAYKGHKDVFEFLVSERADVSHVDDKGDNILHYASAGGRKSVLQSILSHDLVNINSRGKYGWTALMNAAFWGKRKVFDLLVSKGGLAYLVNDRGHNILHLASLGGRLEMVKRILSQNLVNINTRDKRGNTAAMIAKLKGKLDVYNLLVRKG